MIPDDQVRLSQMAPGGGCAAKIGPGTLQGILEQLPRFSDENLLVGIETNDDGAVYRISDELALIQTLDFFPPVVDNPWMFGQIAAANALSDIYAMGGEPKIALNIVAWPNCVNPDILGKILAGGAAKAIPSRTMCQNTAFPSPVLWTRGGCSPTAAPGRGTCSCSQSLWESAW